MQYNNGINMQYNNDINNVNTIINWIYSLDHEVCGFFDVNLNISNVYIGEKDEYGRNMCRRDGHQKLEFHTHPIDSKGYPSIEDIIQVINNKIISISFVFTKWGVWVLERSANTPLIKIKLENKSNDYEKINSYVTGELYSESNRGHDLPDYKHIKKFIEKAEKFFKIDIKFYLYEDYLEELEYLRNRY